MIGSGLEGLFSVSQGLFATNLIFLVSTGGGALYSSVWTVSDY
jgi:hypothetical protein